MEQTRSYFYLAQVVMGGLFILALLWFMRKDTKSGFRVRESELRKKSSTFKAFKANDALGQSRREGPPLLSGISIQGAPHEVLGVAPDASAREVQKAYRELMKRYHPDAVGRPGSREWQDAQKIAEALNKAKDALLSRK